MKITFLLALDLFFFLARDSEHVDHFLVITEFGILVTSVPLLLKVPRSSLDFIVAD